MLTVAVGSEDTISSSSSLLEVLSSSITLSASSSLSLPVAPFTAGSAISTSPFTTPLVLGVDIGLVDAMILPVTTRFLTTESCDLWWSNRRRTRGFSPVKSMTSTYEEREVARTSLDESGVK